MWPPELADRGAEIGDIPLEAAESLGLMAESPASIQEQEEQGGVTQHGRLQPGRIRDEKLELPSS